MHLISFFININATPQHTTPHLPMTYSFSSSLFTKSSFILETLFPLRGLTAFVGLGTIVTVGSRSTERRGPLSGVFLRFLTVGIKSKEAYDRREGRCESLYLVTAGLYDRSCVKFVYHRRQQQQKQTHNNSNFFKFLFVTTDGGRHVKPTTTTKVPPV